MIGEARDGVHRELYWQRWHHHLDTVLTWGPGFSAGVAGASGAFSWGTLFTAIAGFIGAGLAALSKYDAERRAEFHRLKRTDFEDVVRDARADKVSERNMSDEEIRDYNSRLSRIQRQGYVKRPVAHDNRGDVEAQPSTQSH